MITRSELESPTYGVYVQQEKPHQLVDVGDDRYWITAPHIHHRAVLAFGTWRLPLPLVYRTDNPDGGEAKIAAHRELEEAIERSRTQAMRDFVDFLTLGGGR